MSTRIDLPKKTWRVTVEIEADSRSAAEQGFIDQFWNRIVSVEQVGEPKWGDKVSRGIKEQLWFVGVNPKDSGYSITVDESGEVHSTKTDYLKPRKDET